MNNKNNFVTISQAIKFNETMQPLISMQSDMTKSLKTVIYKNNEMISACNKLFQSVTPNLKCNSVGSIHPAILELSTAIKQISVNVSPLLISNLQAVSVSNSFKDATMELLDNIEKNDSESDIDVSEVRKSTKHGIFTSEKMIAIIGVILVVISIIGDNVFQNAVLEKLDDMYKLQHKQFQLEQKLLRIESSKNQLYNNE